MLESFGVKSYIQSIQSIFVWKQQIKTKSQNNSQLSELNSDVILWTDKENKFIFEKETTTIVVIRVSIYDTVNVASIHSWKFAMHMRSWADEIINSIHPIVHVTSNEYSMHKYNRLLVTTCRGNSRYWIIILPISVSSIK